MQVVAFGCFGYSGMVCDAIDMSSGLRYYCDECIANETQAISKAYIEQCYGINPEQP